MKTTLVTSNSQTGGKSHEHDSANVVKEPYRFPMGTPNFYFSYKIHWCNDCRACRSQIIKSSASPTSQSYVTVRYANLAEWKSDLKNLGLEIFLPVSSYLCTAKRSDAERCVMDQNAWCGVRTCLSVVWLIPDQTWGRERKSQNFRITM